MRITSFFMDVPPEADQSHHHKGDGLRRQPEPFLLLVLSHFRAKPFHTFG
ncbi:predicted protein [Brucella abortus bv. 4 str. 292]|uniref:Uncharacterized protein n=5 Tax=Brucella TaxID=234 RepID=Q2YRW4_BRUA2|nr:Hypothetical protein, conserved [Brucella melitensis ATCC 23457]ACU48170.1 hypothetical protein BMI_I1195 [Brucella microti CCM 4915]AEK54499.1 hypothetical protein BPI_I1232 [Brucella pinnipedialis B2/94]EEX55401.1 predicted protein [Brucella abortus bv. 4 str. 292]EEX59222.1 predicted protein [Brucella abortus bv. 2 str. 86/8/59]EEX61855.1 predicted protein [Brucella abortus bv. 6 str. 870]EEX82646.1 predicted protein [Brucella abortus bv. 3 str. Tulya]EEX91189.1 predicted protein [Bruc